MWVHALPGLPGLAILATAALPALAPWRGRALWAVAVLGVLLTTWRAQGLLDQRWPQELHGAERTVEGFVASLPEREGEHWRFLFTPLDPALPSLIRAAWYRSDEIVRGGDCWRLRLKLRTPHGSLNPGGFDYEGWLFRQGIGATATVREAERCAGTPAQPVAAMGRSRLLRARQHVADTMRAALPGSASAGVLTALVVGDRSGITAAQWDLFRLTGTTHLVAISGFNVAIVAAVAFFLCRWLWSAWPPLCLRLPAQRAGLLGSALLAGAYALLAGFEPPVQRAVLMLWIGLVAAWAGRLSHPSRLLAIAWVAVLLVDPFAVLSPGLWLSFGAVAAIFYVSLGRLRPPGWLHGLVLLQLLIALALAPASLFFFNGSSVVAPLVNLLAVPFFALLTPCALAAVLAQLALPAIGAPLLAGAALALDGFHAALQWAAAADLWIAASPPPAALVLAALGVALLFPPAGLPLRRLGMLCLVPLAMGSATPPRGGFELTALDVGQGLAVVVRTARHTLVYDAGPAFDEGFDAGASVVAPFLLSRGVHAIDRLLVSHGDNDHAGGAAAVRRLLSVVDELGAGAAPCRAGQHWEWDGVRFAVLHPDGAGWEGNDASCVLRIDGAFSVLLTGDIGAAAEQALLSGAALGAEVLVSPHHGSASSSSAAFVRAVVPRLVIHSAGWRNHFRHPRPQVVARYAEAGAAQYVTGAGGAISVWRDPGSGQLAVREHRREAARFWNAPAGP
jgi:competence protein ComEC